VFCVDHWYKVNTLVGYGGYGLVASGENIKTGEKVAIKKVQ
jgi:serine/threonine protein kinase